MSDKGIKAKGIMDGFFLDKETVNRIKEILMAIDPDKVKATYKDGVLNVTLAKPESMKPKHIDVETD